MPFIPPGSSEHIPVLHPPVEQTAAVLDKLAALSVDEPLPEVYAFDRVRLLVQSPYRIYTYWNHARDPFRSLRTAFGDEVASSYRLALRLVDRESGEESFHEAGPFSRNHWFDVRPGRAYRVYVGLYAQGRAFIRLLASETVRTPRVTVSQLSDDEPEFNVTATQFVSVLNEAGYASDALEVALEAADEATGMESTRRLARQFTGAEVAVADDAMSEMRALLSALAFGESLEGLLPYLSPELAGWVRRVLDARSEEEMSASRLLDLLHSTLALELEYDERYDVETLEAMRRAARFVWGASDVEMPGPAPRLLLPSMNAGLRLPRARWRTAT